MADIVIVGGSGFIGSHVTQRLLAAGESVTVFDLVPADGAGRFDFVRGDVFDEAALSKVVEGKDLIVDLVGLADIGECQRDPLRSFRLNVFSLAHVLEAARLGDVRKVVFPSSGAVYGKVEDIPIDETATPNPSNVYGWHKLMGELSLRSYRQNYGIRYIILRLFNVIGTANAGVIHHYVTAALAGGPIRGFGRDQLRDFVDADDVANAFYLAATQPEIVDKVINIGSGEGVRISEIAELVRQTIPGTRIEFEEKPGYIPYHSVADIALARKLLNFHPTPGKEVVERFIQEMVHGAR